MSNKINSKLILANAFRDLLKEKTFENITIENILQKSGMSRSTFYRHFEDKYSLMNWLYKAPAEEIISGNPSSSQSKNILIQCFQYIKENQNYFSQIIKVHGQNSFTEFLYSHAQNVTVDRISKAIGKDKLPYELFFSVRFYCGALAFIVTEWLKSGLKESPEELAQLVYDSIPQSIKIYLQ